MNRLSKCDKVRTQTSPHFPHRLALDEPAIGTTTVTRWHVPSGAGRELLPAAACLLEHVEACRNLCADLYLTQCSLT